MVELRGLSPRSERGIVFTTSDALWRGIQRLLDGLMAPATFDDFLVVQECLTHSAGFDGLEVVGFFEAIEREVGLVEEIAREVGVEANELRQETARFCRFVRAAGGVALREPSRDFGRW